MWNESEIALGSICGYNEGAGCDSVCAGEGVAYLALRTVVGLEKKSPDYFFLNV